MISSLRLHCKPVAVISCCCAVFLSGCASDSRLVDPSEAREQREVAVRREAPVQPDTEIIRRDVLMPAMSSINNRIHAYEQKLGEWREVERRAVALPMPPEKLNRIDQCRAQLQDILLEYDALRKQLQQESRVDAAQLLAGNSLLQLNQQDIDYLESGCGNFLAELKATPDPPAVAAINPEIQAAFDSGEYERVINLYAHAAQSPGEVPAPATTFAYVQALLKNHQEAEARKVLGELLPRIRQQKGPSALLLPVLQTTADLDMVLQSHDEARRQYEELIRVSIEQGAHKEEWAGLQLVALQPGSATPAEMKEYTTLLRNYLAYAPKRDGYGVAEQAEKFLVTYPATRLVANVNALRKAAREEADAWVHQGIKRIEALAGERKPPEPSTMGEQASGSLPQPLVAPAAAAGSQAVAVPPAAGGGDVRGQQDEYDKAVAHLQAKEYDKAIERFNRLAGTPFEAKARQQTEEAAKLAAQDMRQKAAELFVRATSSGNPDDKRKLLLSSRDLLQGILVKYPQSGLNDKVQKNLARIEAELRAVDASAAPRPVSGGGAYVPPKTGTSPAPATSL